MAIQIWNSGAVIRGVPVPYRYHKKGMVTVKKLLAVILAVSALGMSAAAAGESAPEITTPHAVLMEKETGCCSIQRVSW